MNTIGSIETPMLLWTTRGAAAAMNISERTLWSLTNKGELPCIRIGRAVRYDPCDIRAWIEAQKTRGSSDETAAETT